MGELADDTVIENGRWSQAKLRAASNADVLELALQLRARVCAGGAQGEAADDARLEVLRRLEDIGRETRSGEHAMSQAGETQMGEPDRDPEPEIDPHANMIREERSLGRLSISEIEMRIGRGESVELRPDGICMAVSWRKPTVWELDARLRREQSGQSGRTVEPQSAGKAADQAEISGSAQAEPSPASPAAPASAPSLAVLRERVFVRLAHSPGCPVLARTAWKVGLSCHCTYTQAVTALTALIAALEAKP